MRVARASKYGNVACKVDGKRFASQKEARRYRELTLLERAGELTDLRLQPRFPIHVAGMKVFTYVADFQYVDAATGDTVVEDSKGYRTDVYRLKRKCFQAQYPHLVFREV